MVIFWMGLLCFFYIILYIEVGKDSWEMDFVFIEWRLDDGFKIEVVIFFVSVYNYEWYMIYLMKGVIL